MIFLSAKLLIHLEIEGKLVLCGVSWRHPEIVNTWGIRLHLQSSSPARILASLNSLPNPGLNQANGRVDQASSFFLPYL